MKKMTKMLLYGCCAVLLSCTATRGVGWMKPEPMLAIEVVENPDSASNSDQSPSDLRIEIKCHP
jgi:hypothetical protein